MLVPEMIRTRDSAHQQNGQHMIRPQCRKAYQESEARTHPYIKQLSFQTSKQHRRWRCAIRILRDKYARERWAFWHKMNSTLLLFSSTSAWHDQNSETTNPKAARNHRKASSQKKILPHPPFSLSLKALGPWLYQKNLGGTEKYLHVLFAFFGNFPASNRGG